MDSMDINGIKQAIEAEIVEGTEPESGVEILSA